MKEVQEGNLSSSSVKVICEEWRPIKGYEGLYEVSNMGNVRSLDRVGYQRHWQGGLSRYFHKGHILKPHKRSNGYMCITLKKDGQKITHNIHRLVAISFIPKPNGKDCINHLDANPQNNDVSNLEWCTQSENIQYAYDHGTKTPPHQKKVGQYDFDGNLIKIWNSQTEPEKALGIFQANIYKVCNGKRKQAGGYIWRYIE